MDGNLSCSIEVYTVDVPLLSVLWVATVRPEALTSIWEGSTIQSMAFSYQKG